MKQFPILWGSTKRPANGPVSVPWSLLAPHEEQAKRNHCGQTLARLAERGGLSVRESLAAIGGVEWGDIATKFPDEVAAVDRLNRLVEEHQGSLARAG